MRRRELLLATTGLIPTLPGCLSSPRSSLSDSPTTSAVESTGAPTRSPTSSHAVNECGFGLHVEEGIQVRNRSRIEESDNDVLVSFGNLSDSRQREFRAALENGSVQVATVEPPWGKGHETIVSYRGEYFAVVALPC